MDVNVLGVVFPSEESFGLESSCGVGEGAPRGHKVFSGENPIRPGQGPEETREEPSETVGS